ncbi:hypothetical protein DFS34DRAFT_706215 [Phlyctochytrium arcticum]|nr:hypothetical protein DFS34DRAFT_706215 [Phlyctochytrium arcticum]
MPAPAFNLEPFGQDLTLDNPKKENTNLLSAIGSAEIVCIGDGSHGTLEFYRERAYITQLLVAEKGFQTIVTEADFPDSMTITRYVQNTSTQDEKVLGAVNALKDFKRFPLWMWRNEVMVPFVKWLRMWNDRLPNDEPKISLYGMDLYSLHTSRAAVLEYLAKVDPPAAAKARERYSLLEPFGEDTTGYAFAARYGLHKGCRDEVVKVLTDLVAKRYEYIKKEATTEADAQFVAEMNARVVKDAEEYYRCMLEEDVKTWNLRDGHMVDAIEQVRAQLDAQQNLGPTKVVVWAHNSHVGDARATDMGRRRGEINVGQLCRERFGKDKVFTFGMTTTTGTVTAADEWDTPGKIMRVNHPLPNSVEHMMSTTFPPPRHHPAHHAHHTGRATLLLTHRIDAETNKRVPLDEDLTDFLDQVRLERFIGVIYRPDTERWSHYSGCALASQFDALIHFHSQPVFARSINRPTFLMLHTMYQKPSLSDCKRKVLSK